MTDYEEGLRLAIKSCWPNASIRGCWWHFKRAVQKKCISLGMAGKFKNSATARQIKRMLTNIPLLPEESIMEAYTKVKEFALKTKMNYAFQKTFSYYENYWLKQVCFTLCSFFPFVILILFSRFKIPLVFCVTLCFSRMWYNSNIYSILFKSSKQQNERNTISVAELEMRTTSSLEAMNSQIQRMLPVKRHLYKFIESLQLHESIKSSDLYQLSTGNITNRQLEKRRIEDRVRDAKIKSLTEQLKMRKISVWNFLKSMSDVKKTVRTYVHIY